MKPKRLVFESVGKDEFKRDSWKCYIKVLHMDNNPLYTPAHYEVVTNISYPNYYNALFWAMNRGIRLTNAVEYSEAISACQDHFNRLIIENCEEEG